MTAVMRIRMRLLRKLLPGYALFFGALLVIGILYGIIAKSPIGIFFLFFGFISLRYSYKDKTTYHNDSTKKCIALSIALFAISALPLVIFDTRVGLLSSIPIAIGMTWILYVFGAKKNLEIEVERLSTSKKFDLDHCTEAELIARCKERFKRDVEYKTERAIKHFILKLPHDEIDVSVEQSKKERYRFRKILE